VAPSNDALQLATPGQNGASPTERSVRRRGGIESYARRIAGRWIDSARRKNWVTHANHLVT
jgi:hypothetical protein